MDWRQNNSDAPSEVLAGRKTVGNPFSQAPGISEGVSISGVRRDTDGLPTVATASGRLNVGVRQFISGKGWSYKPSTFRGRDLENRSARPTFSVAAPKNEHEWAAYNAERKDRHGLIHVADIRALVENIIVELRLDTKASLDDLIVAYSGLVSPFIARHSRPTALRNGILTIACDNATISFELRQHAERISRLLAEKFGVKETKFRQ